MAHPDSNPQLPESLPYNRLDILQADQEDIFSSIPNLAINLAVLGRVDVARSLVSKLNTYHSDHGRGTILSPLWLLWDLTNDWPKGEEEAVRKNIEDGRKREKKEKEAEENQEPAGKQPRLDPNVEKPITREDVRKSVDYRIRSLAESWHWPGKPNILVWQPDEERARYYQGPHREGGIEAAEKCEWIKKLWAEDDGSAILSALDLRISLEDEEGAMQSLDGVPSVQQILDRLVEMHRANSKSVYPRTGWKLSNLAESRQAWKMLKEGVLAKTMNVDPKKLSAFANDVEEAFEVRLKTGRQEPYPDLSIKDLLEVIQKNSKSNPRAIEHFEEMGDPVPETIMRSPATDAEIQDTEKRLDTQLPPDYLEFARLTNGLGAPFGGILFDPALHPLKDIRWFTDDEDYFLELQLDMPGDMAWLRRNLEDYPNWVLVSRALEIGTEDIFNTWLVPPSKTAEVQKAVADVLASDEYSEQEKTSVRNTVENFAGSMEAFNKLGWACVTWASGGGPAMQAYPSFRAYLAAVAKEGGKAKEDVLVDGVFFADYLGKE